MSGPFKVGDVCIGVGFVIDTDRNGRECVVISALELMTTTNLKRGFDSTAYRHLVEWDDGQVAAIKPPNLRRKQPPAGEELILRLFTAPAPCETEAA